jgi:Helix-turn-helix domain
MKRAKKPKKSEIKTRKAIVCAQARADITLSHAAVRVFDSLIWNFRNNRDGRCNPSYDTISDASGVGRRSVIPAIRELEAAGWINVETTRGGSSRCTNRYTIHFGKTAAEVRQQSEWGKKRATSQDQSELVHTCALATETELVQDSYRASADVCTRTSPEPLEKERGRESPNAACGFAAPLKKQEEELAFQHLFQNWPRYRVWPDRDETKARAAFAAVEANHGDEIRAQGLSVGHYLLNRARVWIAAFEAAHPNGDGPRYLKKLEVWLGAPDDKGKASPWWSLVPTPKVSGGRSAKPDFLNLGLGRRAS